MIGKRLIRANEVADRMFYIYHFMYEGDQTDYKRWFRSDLSIKEIRGSYRKTKVPCSSWCCGNPRKWWNTLTPQEKKANDDYEFQLQDLE